MEHILTPRTILWRREICMLHWSHIYHGFETTLEMVGEGEEWRNWPHIRPRNPFETSLVGQWLRIHLPMQGAWVRALVWEDPTYCRATKPVCHNFWACALEPASHNYWARGPQLLKPACLEPVLRHKRSYHNKKPVYHNEEYPLLAVTRESPCAATKTQCSQK